MESSPWRRFVDQAFRQAHHYASMARAHVEDREVGRLSTESWANWLLYLSRNGLVSIGPLQNWLDEYMTDEERADLERLSNEFATFKMQAVRAGAHLLPGDMPKADEPE